MSLIEEALRRVQGPAVSAPKEQATTTAPPPQTEPPPVHSWQTTIPQAPTPSLPSPRTSNTILIAASAILGFTAVLIIGGLLWLREPRREPPVMASSPVIAQTQAIMPASTALSQPAAPAPSTTPAAEPRPKSLRTMLSSPPPPAAQRSLILSGIAEGSGEPYAVINGEIVGVGDQVSGATLLSIVNGRVTLRRADGTEAVLRLPQ